MTNPTFLVAKREYFKVVRKKSFWLLILLLPTFYIVITIVSGTSAESVEKKIVEQAKEAQRIIVVDQAGLISDNFIQKPIERSTDATAAAEAVRNGQADAAFIYPSDLAQSLTVTSYISDNGIIGRGRFDALGESLVKQSILEKIDNPEQTALFNTHLTVDKTVYKDGQKIITSIEAFILPILAIVVYFLLTITSSSYMLMGISEEKENRMIETIRSIITSRQLIWGKLIGMVGLAFTQLITLAVFGIVAYQLSSNILPIEINWSLVSINPWQIILTIFFIASGFVFMAALMVGIGAAMPTYRDAQQASPLFIILSILPIYFAYVLIAEPAGPIAIATSYIPFMSPLVLTFRTSIDALPIWEQFVGIGVTLIYMWVGLYLAFKLFEIGSMELGKKVSLKNAFRK
ncbi:MAG: ABC transporter permease [bacterium]